MSYQSKDLLELNISGLPESTYFLLKHRNKSMALAKSGLGNGVFLPVSQLEPVNENCDWLYQLSSRAVPFIHLIQTTILPFFLTLTVIINILLCITLNRPNMRTPTNFILLAISVTDLLTGLLPLPILTAFNTDYFDTDLTLAKGYLTHYCSVVLPTIFHTISIWLTVLLALQRSADKQENNGNSQMTKRNRKNAVNGDAYKTSRIMLVVLLLFLFVEIPSTVLVTTYSLLIALEEKPMAYFAEVSSNAL
ncbi:hypothetical protein ACTXT7_007135 [Hymenolepis weldensis]